MAYPESTGLSNDTLAKGWVDQPDGGGTLDILKSCVVTTFLCSWSVLFLNVPDDFTSRLHFIIYKIRWMFFTLLFPEMITAIAAEQWRSARQSAEDFSKLKDQWQSNLELSEPHQHPPQIFANLSQFQQSPWTMRHAFFADMGGFHLHCPDFKPFPINAHQLHYLVQNHHLSYPDIKEKAIWDRNKADGLARVLTVAQTTWFVAQSLARLIQHLALSTFELSTIAFIFCTVNTVFFWRHKPLDVETPIILRCQTRLDYIIREAGDQNQGRYSSTPLDFVNPSPKPLSLIEPFWFALKVSFTSSSPQRELPIRAFENTSTVPPRGLKIADVVYGAVFTTGYVAIHIAGWNMDFPSLIERSLWRISSFVLLGLIIFYLAAFSFGTTMAGALAKTLFNNAVEHTLVGVASLLPRWVAILMHLPVVLAYSVARTYIICEGFVGLRSLPNTAFDSVKWSNFVPHM